MMPGYQEDSCAGCGTVAVTREAREKLPKGMLELRFATFRICADCLAICKNAGAIQRFDPIVLLPKSVQWLKAMKGIR